MIKCPNCSGEMEFDATLLKVKCKYCGEVFDNTELLEKTDIQSAVMQKEEENVYEGTSYKCTQCGATLMTFDDTAITFCSYCGSQAMLEDN